MNDQVPQGHCLHCGASKSDVRKLSLGCGEDDYWGEVSWEMDKHRWADWTDSTLKQYRILPQFFHLYRRANFVAGSDFIDCEHQGFKHEYTNWGNNSWICEICYSKA